MSPTEASKQERRAKATNKLIDVLKEEARTIRGLVEEFSKEFNVNKTDTELFINEKIKDLRNIDMLYISTVEKCMENYMQSDKKTKALFNKNVLFFLGKEVLAFLEKEGIGHENLLEKLPLDAQVYTYKKCYKKCPKGIDAYKKCPEGKYIESRFAAEGRELFYVYAREAVLNYLKIAQMENFPDDIKFLQINFGYPTQEMLDEREETSTTLWQDAKKCIPITFGRKKEELIENFETPGKREEAHAKAVNSLLNKLNENLTIEMYLGSRGFPDIIIKNKDPDFEGALEIKTLREKLRYLGEHSTLAQVLRYLTKYKVVVLSTTADFLFFNEATKGGKQIRNPYEGETGALFELTGKKMLKNTMNTCKRQYRQDYSALKKQIDESTTKFTSAKYLVEALIKGGEDYKTALKKLTEYKVKIGYTWRIGSLNTSYKKLVDSVKEFGGQLSKKKILLMRGECALKLFEKDKGEILKKLMDTYDIIFGTISAKDFIRLCEDHSVGSSKTAMEKLVKWSSPEY